MEKVTYYGIVHKDKGSDYGVSFPDFPGCVTADRDFEKLAPLAREALEFHIAGMIEDGEAVPEASKPADMDKDGGVAIIAVTVSVPRVRVKRFNIAAREADMKRIDGFLKKSGRSRDRSEFLIQSALREIERSKQA